MFIVYLNLPGVYSQEPAYEQAPILYSESEPVTRLTKIRDRIEQGEDLLSGATGQEKLGKLLTLLEVPLESQVLVYSKTSAQNSLIAPEHPRAIYFSDNAYVGWVQNGNIEVITFDKKLGMVFHLLDITQGNKVKFIRDQSCLNCHGESSTNNWPGIMVRSVFPQKNGQPLYHAGTYRTDHSSPLEERWGGWYVTGDSGKQSHLGNILAQEDAGTRKVTYQPMALAAVKSLDGLFPTEPYLAGGSSDMVALMILEHQVSVHNALVEGNLAARQTLYRHIKMKEVFGEAPDSPMSESNQSVLDSQAERIAGKLLFADEQIMKDAGVEGAVAFQQAFARNARFNRDRRSLKDLRLYERLFKYRCSYLIDSEAFHHLPQELKIRVWAKLSAALAVPARGDSKYQHLSDSEKVRITEILEDTIPTFSK